MYETILYEVKEAVAYITLNRPDRFNAFNEKMSYELLAALREARKAASVHVAIVISRGRESLLFGPRPKRHHRRQRSSANR
jgi:2-(1,2-epoxy-1,2-dihydrophenyl)acetyl-CoA isomerase